MYRYIPSLPDLLPHSPPSQAPRSSQSIGLSSLGCIAGPLGLRSLQYTAGPLGLSSLWYTAGPLGLSSLRYAAGPLAVCFAYGGVCTATPVSDPSHPALPALCPHVHSLCLRRCPCLARRFICTAFLDSAYFPYDGAECSGTCWRA